MPCGTVSRVDTEGSEAPQEQEEQAGEGLTAWDGLPGIPASAGALIRDEQGRILLLKPTCKSGWTIPGGVMEADGETPWQACQREVREETGLAVASGRLVAVDTRPAKRRKAMGLRFLFDCGVIDAAAAAGIVVQESEVSDHAFVSPDEALTLLRPAVRRRVASVLGLPPGAGACYLEDGMPVGPAADEADVGGE